MQNFAIAQWAEIQDGTKAVKTIFLPPSAQTSCGVAITLERWVESVGNGRKEFVDKIGPRRGSETFVLDAERRLNRERPIFPLQKQSSQHFAALQLPRVAPLDCVKENKLQTSCQK